MEGRFKVRTEMREEGEKGARAGGGERKEGGERKLEEEKGDEEQIKERFTEKKAIQQPSPFIYSDT